MPDQGLKITDITLMTGTALFFDALQFLLGFLYTGWVAGIFAGLTFWLWFRLKGVKISFGHPKRVLFFSGTSLIEMVPIPFLASLPAWTAFVLITGITNKIGGIIPGPDMAKPGIIKK